MKRFRLALIVTLACGACLSAWASSPVGASADVAGTGGGALVQTAAYGDPPRTGRRHGGGKTRASKSATPGVSTTKGVSQDEADKLYKQKYGF